MMRRAGVKTDEHGYIVTDDQCQTSADGSGRSVTATAAAPVRAPRGTTTRPVVANLVDADPRRISDRIPCYGLYIDGALGRIGMTERRRTPPHEPRPA